MATPTKIKGAKRTKGATKPASNGRRGRKPREFTRADLDKVLRLRKEGIGWDGDEGICAQLGVGSAIPIRNAMREAGGKYEDALSARPRRTGTEKPAGKSRTATRATGGRKRNPS